MKWYDRIGIVVWCLILFPLFVLLSTIAHLTGLEWWPEFFLIMAEAALSVLVVLFIIEASSRRERKRRWEAVKTFTYLRILERLAQIGYFVCRTTFMVYLEPLNIDRERIESHGISGEDAAFVLRSLGDSIREHYTLLYDLYNTARKDANKDKNPAEIEDKDPMELAVKDLIECFNNINHEINEYKIALVPRVLALSDDEEVNFALLEFEEIHSRIFLNEDFLKRYNPDSSWFNNSRKYIVLGENFVNPAFISLADLLKYAGNLFDLISRRLSVESENGLIEETILELKRQVVESMQELKAMVKYWWLPPSNW